MCSHVYPMHRIYACTWPVLHAVYVYRMYISSVWCHTYQQESINIHRACTGKLIHTYISDAQRQDTNGISISGASGNHTNSAYHIDIIWHRCIMLSYACVYSKVSPIWPFIARSMFVQAFFFYVQICTYTCTHPIYTFCNYKWRQDNRGTE